MQETDYQWCAGAVYSMTNAAESNEVIALCRRQDGKLDFMKAYPTGGNGTGAEIVDPLGSQGSIILSRYGCFLFVVNAGSNSISSFRVAENGALALADVEPSGGVMPNSLAVSGSLLYVSNMGDPDHDIPSNITGFWVNDDGCLIQIKGSTSFLSTPDAQPASLDFSPNGRLLVVSEVNNNRLTVFRVKRDGTLSRPTINESNGEGPFGLVFLSSGVLLVSEAGANALSSYCPEPDGTLFVISGSIPNGQLATCWVVPSKCEHFAFTSNTGSGTITTYQIEKKGQLELDDIAYSTLDELGAPIDSGVSCDGQFFYVLNGNQGTISAFVIKKDGSLVRLQVIKGKGLPTIGAQGLAVF